jgi:hypothetical protein
MRFSPLKLLEPAPAASGWMRAPGPLFTGKFDHGKDGRKESVA